MTFENFLTIDPSFTVKVAENGWVLEVSGRDQDNDWIEKTYVFREETLFFATLSRVGEIAG